MKLHRNMSREHNKMNIKFVAIEMFNFGDAYSPNPPPLTYTTGSHRFYCGLFCQCTNINGRADHRLFGVRGNLQMKTIDGRWFCVLIAPIK